MHHSLGLILAQAGVVLFACAFVGLTAPAVGQVTTFEDRQSLGVDDLAITPDGRYAVARTTAFSTRTYVVDLALGLEVFSYNAMSTAGVSGPCVDAVEVTNERAVSLGAQVVVLDLTTQPPSLLSSIDCGSTPRDVAITDDGRFAVVRGGTGPRGGAYIIELSTGAEVLFQQSEIQSFLFAGNDLCEATQDHGVVLSFDPGTFTTNVLVAEVDPAGGSGPRVVFETMTLTSLAGRPMDVAVSPDGLFAAVRSEDEVALLRLDGTNTQIIQRQVSFPGPTTAFLDTAFDTVVMTDDVWASITIGSASVSDGYLNLGDESGTSWTALLDGVPRDLVVTPDQSTLLVHTGEKLYEFDLTALPAGGGMLQANNFVPLLASTSGLLAGLDSIECTDDTAIAIYPTTQGTRFLAFDLTAGGAPLTQYDLLIPGFPIDLAIDPEGSFAIAVTQDEYAVVDLRTRTTRLEVSGVSAGFPGWPWGDGAAIHPDHALASGVAESNSQIGWLDSIDLLSRAELSCTANVNSTGANGDLFALGSTRVSDNDLRLEARFLPMGQFGVFVLGDAPSAVTVGGGLMCVGGNDLWLPVQATTAAGTASQVIDFPTLPSVGGGLVPGSTWLFQFVHRDVPMTGGIGTSNAISLMFQ